MAAVRRSTTEIGTAFEKHSQRYLNNQLHMSVRRVGKAGDGGVDLRGSWYVPRETLPGPSRSSQRESLETSVGDEVMWRRLRVLGQCKAEGKPLGPRAVRELEGVVAHLEASSRKGKERSLSPAHSELSEASSSEPLHEDYDPASSIIAILLSQSGFSKNAMLHAFKSHTPLMLVHLPGGQISSSDSAADNPLLVGEKTIEGEAWWNAALSGPAGVIGGKMELRREILTGSEVNQITGDAAVKARYGLWHGGKRFTRLGPDLGEMEMDY